MKLIRKTAAAHTYEVWLGRDSSVGIATRYRLQRSGDRIPVGSTFSAPVETGLGSHPATYVVGTRSFPGVKRPERGVDHPPPCIAETKERVPLLPLCAFLAGHRVKFTVLEVHLHVLVTLALDGCTFGTETKYPLSRRLDERQSGRVCIAEQKNVPLPAFELPTIQPVASLLCRIHLR